MLKQWTFVALAFNIICLFDFAYSNVHDAPNCYLKKSGVCIDNGFPCPFVKGKIRKDRIMTLSSKKRLCPKKMFCCVPPSNRDRHEYGIGSPSCGILNYSENKDPAHRIIGGHKAKLEQFPWQVSIKCGEYQHECGGTLIHPQWVITAAHCRRESKCPLSQIRVVMGKVNAESDGGETRHVEEYIAHEMYGNFKHDLALIKLSEPVELNSKINTACLPNPDEDFSNMMCIASGFGLTVNNGVASKELMFLPVPTVPYDRCQGHWGKDNVTLDDSLQTCAGYKAGIRDSCSGDSGGPLVCLKKDRVGTMRYILGGVTSFGDDYCGKPEAYAVYTRPSAYLSWINEKTDNLFT